MKLADVVNRTPAFWRVVGNKAVRALKDQTAKGRDFDGAAFPAYKDEYRKAKMAGKFKRQASKSGNPNLRLTGDMMRDLKVLGIGQRYVEIGWPAFGDRMTWNAEGGRAIIDVDSPNDPHPALQEAVYEALHMETDAAAEKFCREPLIINLKR